jgi:uncharacterized protein (TIGR03067 family)
MTFSKSFVAVAVLTWATVVNAEPPKIDAAKADVAKLQGTWQMTALTDEMGAAPAKELSEWTFEFNGDKVTNSQSKDRKGRSLTYALDPSKEPKTIDMSDGGLVIEGIYRVDGDDLTICLVTGSRNGKTAPRPPQFKADKSKKYSLFVLKRVKK